MSRKFIVILSTGLALTIHYWLSELEEMGLILRMQLGLNEPSHTFIIPYKD